MAMGPSKYTIQVSYDGNIVENSIDDTKFSLQGNYYNFFVSVILFCGNSRNMFHCKVRLNNFIINKEGSISPKNDPNVSIGREFL